MTRKARDPDVVYVERESESRDSGGSSPLWWLLVGGAIGAGLALLLAPRSGAETRRELASGARRLRVKAKETLTSFTEGGNEGEEHVAGGAAGIGAASGAWEPEDDEEWEDVDDDMDDEVEDEAEEEVEEASHHRPRATLSEARRELERRLERAKARRATGPDETPASDDEEPGA